MPLWSSGLFLPQRDLYSVERDKLAAVSDLCSSLTGKYFLRASHVMVKQEDDYKPEVPAHTGDVYEAIAVGGTGDRKWHLAAFVPVQFHRMTKTVIKS